MLPQSQTSSEWSDDDELDLAPPAGVPLVLAGLPESWRSYKQWLAGIVFSAVWIADSWIAGGALPGMEGIRHMTRSLWGLLLTLALSYGIYHFLRHRFEKLGLMLAVLIAAAALARYGL